MQANSQIQTLMQTLVSQKHYGALSCKELLK